MVESSKYPFYDNPDFTGLLHGRIDANVDFDWGEANPWPGFDDAFSVRWTGLVRTLGVSGYYTFYANTDDGVRLWVNGQLIIDQWVVQSATESSGTSMLDGYHDYTIVMEYFDDGGPAVAQLRWEPPGLPKGLIPAGNLLPGRDCNLNGVPDDCDIGAGVSQDANTNGVPDECEMMDCNTNGVADAIDIAEGTSADCNGNGVPDECEMVTSGVLYTLDEWSALSTVNPQTGEVTWVADLSPSAQAAFGVAFGPGPGGQLYAIIEANSTGQLVTIDPMTGEWSSKGIPPESIEDIAWGSDGQLYGVLFSGQFMPGEVVIINPTDASISHPGITVAGGDRQSIALKPGTRLLYHTSDINGNGQSQLEVMDLTTGIAQWFGQ